jgi:hypothetical protein
MAFTTFSGPIRSGTQRYGGVTTLNTGVPVLAQTATVPPAAITTSPSAVNLFTLPAGSKILRFKSEKTAVITGATAIAAVFGNATAANAYLTTATNNINPAATPSVQAPLDLALVTANTNNIGTSDVTITGTFTATGANAVGGSVVITCEYLQRADDGSQVPASA